MILFMRIDKNIKQIPKFYQPNMFSFVRNAPTIFIPFKTINKLYHWSKIAYLFKLTLHFLNKVQNVSHFYHWAQFCMEIHCLLVKNLSINVLQNWRFVKLKHVVWRMVVSYMILSKLVQNLLELYTFNHIDVLISKQSFSKVEFWVKFNQLNICCHHLNFIFHFILFFQLIDNCLSSSKFSLKNVRFAWKAISIVNVFNINVR